jgi:hypothetical protein
VLGARNVVILLSYNYALRPYCIVELHTALMCGANICPILVTREGMTPFSFAQVTEDIQTGANANYLDAGGWSILKQFNIGPKELAAVLKALMNVRAFEFTTSLASSTSMAMAKEALLKVD